MIKQRLLAQIFSTILLSFISLTSFAEPICNNTNPGSQITAFMQGLTDNNDIVGGIVGFYHNGQVQYYSFGNISRDNPSKPTATTIYKIASVTKVFTATLLASSVVDHNVNLNDTIDAYLPAYVHLQAAAANKITFEQLATHTASFPDYPPATVHDAQSFFNDYLSQWQPPYPLGTQFQYSDLSFELLAFLLQKINDESFQQLLADKITTPLAMPSTQSVITANYQFPLAMGYRENGMPIGNKDNTWNKIAYLVSNAQDLMNFVKANLGVINLPGNLSSAINLTHQPFFQINPRQAQGLGWGITTIKTPQGAIKFYGKNGGIPGYASYIGFNPQANTGIVMLASYQVSDDKKVSQMQNLGMCLLRTVR